jgi:ATP-dependent helicase/nuclease subunit B
VRTSLETAADDTEKPGAACVYTVPPGRAFLAAIADAILRGDLPASGGAPPDPLVLAGYTLLLPTRRAARALQEAFLEAGGGRAMTLPCIRPISQSEENLTLLSSLAADSPLGASALELPPAVSEITRRLALTQLVLQWSKVMRRAGDEAGFLSDHAAAAGANTPAQAAHLAAELGRLMDMVETERPGAPVLDELATLVPEEFSEHWQQTIAFLKIITEAWPAHLAEKGLLSPAERRNRAILSEAERLAATPPEGPVIVAGVTGSIPATVELMRAVAALPHGAIVLPGLDPHLDYESWVEISKHPEHPQFGLKTLLDRLGLDHRNVQVLAGSEPAPAQADRAALIAEAMRPSGTTGRWHAYTQATDHAAVRAALSGVSLIEAPSAQDEAEVVALILREAAETPGRTAALVSPDRLLARRVAVRLEAWGIRVDDSAGRPFGKTPPGTFLDLVINAITKEFAPAEVMALLKHPLTRLGRDAFTVRRAARALEIAAFRDVYLGRGPDGLAHALEQARDAVDSGERRQRAAQRLRDNDWEEAHDLVQRLNAAYAPLLAVFAERGEQPLQTIAAAHVATAEVLSRLSDNESETEATPLWRDEAGAAAAAFFTGVMDPSLTAPQVRATDYADLYRSLIATENVRQRTAVHPRLFIWGPFEARLQQTDVMVLGSLNDGTWPEAADPGPWLNRPMREKLGLPSPEEKIGYAAHDFTSFLGAERVYLTRAQKIDGVPTVPSRWLMRLNALLAGLGLQDALQTDAPWLGWARARDAYGERIRLAAPAPCPPVAARPRKMSVTRVETWLANPYAIYAQNILRLEKLPQLGADPGPALRGSIVHKIMSVFAKRHPEALPADAHAELAEIADEIMAAYTGNPRVAAFWLPRFKRFAQWFAETEPARRAGVTRIAAEVDGAMVVAGPAGPFTLSARADRIDERADGLVIIDYKTGVAPNDRAVTSGLSPQLPLEAAIAGGEAGFAGIPERRVAALHYIRATGGEPSGEERTVKTDDVAGLADAALQQLTRLIAVYDDPATPYKALRRARFNYDYDDYAHLARVAEWAVGGEEDEA